MRLAPTFSAYTGSRGRKKSQPLTWSAYSAAALASSQPRSRKPVSVIRSRVPSPAGSSSKTTRNELPGAADSPSSWVHRNENSRGGSASTTWNCTQPMLAALGVPEADPARSPGHGRVVGLVAATTRARARGC